MGGIDEKRVWKRKGKTVLNSIEGAEGCTGKKE